MTQTFEDSFFGGRAKPKKKGEANSWIDALIQELYRFMSVFIFKVICKASIILSILIDTTCTGNPAQLYEQISLCCKTSATAAKHRITKSIGI